MARTIKARVSGAWVPVTRKIRVGGAWVPIAAVTPGASYEGLSLVGSPTSADTNDGTQAYNMGTAFTSAAARNCVGVRWLVPTSVVLPNGYSHNASLWSNAGTRLANVDFTPTPGTSQDILFSTPVALTAATSYRVAIYTNHYTYRSSPGYPLSSASGNISASGAFIVAFNGGPNVFPNSSSGLYFYVSPLVATS